jgi:hypothetical protein
MSRYHHQGLQTITFQSLYSTMQSNDKMQVDQGVLISHEAGLFQTTMDHQRSRACNNSKKASRHYDIHTITSQDAAGRT